MNTIKAYTLSVTALIGVLLSSCGRAPVEPVPITRLDRILAEYCSYDHLRQVEAIDSFKPEIDAMFAVMGDPIVTVGTLQRWSQSDAVRVFQPAVDSVYPDLSNLERQIGQMLYRASEDSLRVPKLRYATVTWGNPRPIVRVDSVMLIALNHFLGADYPGYAQWQDYRRIEKSPEALPYSIAGALVATQYPMTPTASPTLLSWMLYEGALAEARMRLVPEADAARALGFTPEQYAYATDHSRAIWEEMAVRKIIYSTDPLTIDRYIAPAPATPLMQSQAPGRIGRYIGWRIVKAYIKRHPSVRLSDLLSPSFYNDAKSLIDSGFDGR